MPPSSNSYRQTDLDPNAAAGALDKEQRDEAKQAMQTNRGQKAVREAAGMAEADRRTKDSLRAAELDQRAAEKAVADQQRLADQQAKQAAREQKTAADVARKAALSKQELDMRMQGMIPVTTADGNLHPDPLWEQKQAEKAAKAAQEQQAAQLSDQFTVEGRKNFKSKVTGLPTALESDEMLASRKQAEQAARIDKARKARHSQELETLKAEVSLRQATRPPLSRDRATGRPELELDEKNGLPALLGQAHSALLDRLSKQSAEKSGTDDWTPWNEAPTPAAKEAADRLARLQTPNDLTDDDLALLDSDVATKPIREKIQSLRAQIAADDEDKAFYDAKQIQIQALTLKAVAPEKYAVWQRQRRSKMTPQELQADLEASSADLQTRAQELQAKAAPIQQRRALTQQKLNTLSQQAAERRQRGLMASEIVTFTRPDGSTEDWPADLAATYEREVAMNQEAETQEAATLEQLQALQDDLQAEATLHDEGAAALTTKAQEQQQTAKTSLSNRLRFTPGMEQTAGELEALKADAATRKAVLDDMHPDGVPDEALAALNADVQSKAEQALQTGEARLNSAISAYGDIQAQLRANPDLNATAGDLFITARQQLAQAAGIPEAEAKRLLDDAAALDWDQATADEMNNGSVAESWKSGKNMTQAEDSRKTRLLSNGAVIVHPSITDEKGYTAAVAASGATPDAQAEALARYPQIRAAQAQQTLETIQEVQSVNAFGLDGADWADWQKKRPADVDEAEWALRWTEHNKAATAGPLGLLLSKANQFKRSLFQSGNDLRTQVGGMIAGVTGSETVMQDAQWSSRKAQAHELAKELGGNTSDNFLTKGIFDMLPRVGGSLVISGGSAKVAQFGVRGFAATKLGARFLPSLAATIAKAQTPAQGVKAIDTLTRAGLGGAAAGGAGQTYGANFVDIYTAQRKEHPEMDHVTAMRQAQMPAVISGLATAALTVLGGAKGIERLFVRPAEARQLMGKVFTSRMERLGFVGSEFLKGGIRETLLEEAPDELISQVAAAIGKGHSVQQALGDFFRTLPEMAVATMALGGAGEGISSYQESSVLPAMHLRPETTATAWSAIENHRALTPDGVEDPNLTSQEQNRASLALHLAQGGELFDVSEELLNAAGWTRDGTKFKPLKDYAGPKMLDIDTGGMPVIKDAYVKALSEHPTLAPVAKAIGMTETETRNFYAARNTDTPQPSGTPAGQAPASATVPNANPGPVQAPPGAGTPPPPSGNPAAQSGAPVTTPINPVTNVNEVPSEAPETPAGFLANHFTERGLPRDQAQTVAEAVTARPEFAGMSYEQIIAEGPKFRAALDELGIDGSLNSKDVATNPLKVQPGSKLAKVKAEMEAKAAAAGGQTSASAVSPAATSALPPSVQSALDDAIPGTPSQEVFAAVKAAVKAKEMTEQQAAEIVAQQSGAKDHTELRQALENKLGWTTAAANTAAANHFGDKSKSDIPLAAGKKNQQPASSIQQPGRAGPDQSWQDPASPLRKHRAWTTEKLRVLSSLRRPAAPTKGASATAQKKYQKALRAFESKQAWTREVFRLLENNIAKHHAFIEAIALGKTARSHLDGNSAAITVIGGKVTLAIDADALIANISDLESPQDRIEATFNEEYIHVAQKKLEALDPKNYGRDALIKKWDALPDALRKAVWTSYRNANQRAKSAKDARLPATLSDGQKYHLMQEFNRMLVQDKDFAGKITETVDPASGILEWVKSMLQKLGDILREMITRLPKAQQTEIQEHVRRVSELYQQLASASQGTSAERLGSIPTVTDHQAVATQALTHFMSAKDGIFQPAALAKIWDLLDPSLQRLVFRSKDRDPVTGRFGQQIASRAPKHDLMRDLLAMTATDPKMARAVQESLLKPGPQSAKSLNLLDRLFTAFAKQTAQAPAPALAASNRADSPGGLSEDEWQFFGSLTGSGVKQPAGWPKMGKKQMAEWLDTVLSRLPSSRENDKPVADGIEQRSHMRGVNSHPYYDKQPTLSKLSQNYLFEARKSTGELIEALKAPPPSKMERLEGKKGAGSWDRIFQKARKSIINLSSHLLLEHIKAKRGVYPRVNHSGISESSYIDGVRLSFHFDPAHGLINLFPDAVHRWEKQQTPTVSSGGSVPVGTLAVAHRAEADLARQSAPSASEVNSDSTSALPASPRSKSPRPPVSESSPLLAALSTQSPDARRALATLHSQTLSVLADLIGVRFVIQLPQSPAIQAMLEAEPPQPEDEQKAAAGDKPAQVRLQGRRWLLGQMRLKAPGTPPPSLPFSQSQSLPPPAPGAAKQTANRQYLADLLALIQQQEAADLLDTSFTERRAALDAEDAADHGEASTNAAGAKLRAKLRLQQLATVRARFFRQDNAVRELHLAEQAGRQDVEKAAAMAALATGRIGQRRTGAAWRTIGFTERRQLALLGIGVDQSSSGDQGGYPYTLSRRGMAEARVEFSLEGSTERQIAEEELDWMKEQEADYQTAPDDTSPAYVQNSRENWSRSLSTQGTDHILLKQEALDDLALSYPHTAALIRPEHAAREGFGIPSAQTRRPITQDSSPVNPVTPVNEAPTFTPIAENQSPFTQGSADTPVRSESPRPQVSPSPSLAFSIPLSKRGQVRRSQFPDADSLAAFQFKLDADTVASARSTPAEIKKAEQRGLALLARLMDETTLSRSDLEKKLLDYHATVVQQAEAASAFGTFTPPSFASSTSSIQDRASSLPAPTGGDIISGIKGQGINRLGPPDSSDGWAWYRALERDAALSKLKPAEAQRRARKGDIADAKAKLAWLQENLVSLTSGRSIDEAATELSESAEQQFAVASGEELGQAILSALDARLAAKENPASSIQDQESRREAEALGSAQDFATYAAGTPGQPFTADQLAQELDPEDEIQIGSEYLTVLEADKDTGTLTLDSSRFGSVTVSGDQTLNLASGPNHLRISKSPRPQVSPSSSTLADARAELIAAVEEDTSLGASTRTPAFDRWFGGSKVTDAQGQPLRVYHGTRANFGEFTGSRLFFSDDATAAASYSRLETDETDGSSIFDEQSVIMPAFLSLQNPLIVDAQGLPWHRVPLLIQQQLPGFESPISTNDASVWDTIDGLSKHAETGGFDGLIVRNVRDHNGYANNGTSTTFVAFKPGQIKSVFNRGDWNSRNPNVLAASNRTRLAAASYVEEAIKDHNFRTLADLLRFAATDLPAQVFAKLRTPHLYNAWNTVQVENNRPEATRPEEADALRALAPQVERRYGEMPPDIAAKQESVTPESMGIPTLKLAKQAKPVTPTDLLGNPITDPKDEEDEADPKHKVQNRGSTELQRLQAIDEVYGPLAPGVEVMETKNQDGDTVPHIMRGRGLMLSVDGQPHVAIRSVALPSVGSGHAPGVRFFPLAGDKSNWTGHINKAIQIADPQLDEHTDVYIEPYGGGLVYLQNLEVLLKTSKPVLIASSQEFEPDRNLIFNTLKNGDAAAIADLRSFLTDINHAPQTDAGEALFRVLYDNPEKRRLNKATEAAAAQLPKLIALLQRPNVKILPWNDVQTFEKATAMARTGKRVTLLEDSNYADLYAEGTQDQYKGIDTHPDMFNAGKITNFIGKDPKKLLAQKLPVYRAVLDAGGTVIATNNMNPDLINGLLAEFGDTGHWFGFAHRTRPVPDGFMRHPDGKGVLWSTERPEYLAILQKGVVNPPAGAPKYGTDTPAGLDFRKGARRSLEEIDRAAQPRRTPSPHTGGSLKAAQSLLPPADTSGRSPDNRPRPTGNAEPRTPVIDATLAGGPNWDRTTSAKVAQELDQNRSTDPLDESPEVEALDYEAQLQEDADRFRPEEDIDEDTILSASARQAAQQYRQPDGSYRIPNALRGINATATPNDAGVAGKGPYYTLKEHVAKMYAGKDGKVIRADLTLRKPLIATYSTLNKLQERLYGRMLTGFEPELSQQFDTWMRQKGYDGAILYEEEEMNQPAEIVTLAAAQRLPLSRALTPTTPGASSAFFRNLEPRTLNREQPQGQGLTALIPVTPRLLSRAYQSALRGQSSGWLPIKAVWDQFHAQNPAVTPAAFMRSVQEGDNAGSVLLSPPESAATVEAAGPFKLRNASGIVVTEMTLAAAPRRARESMTFDPPFRTAFGDILSYDWMSQPVGGMENQRISDWSAARTNPATGREIVHHFKVRKPDGIHTVSLETALGQLSKEQRSKLQGLIKAEQERRQDQSNGQLALFSAHRQFAPAIRFEGRVTAAPGGMHYDALVEQVRRTKLPSWQREQDDSRRLAIRWIRENPSAIEKDYTEGFMTPQGFKDRFQALTLARSMGYQGGNDAYGLTSADIQPPSYQGEMALLASSARITDPPFSTPESIALENTRIHAIDTYLHGKRRPIANTTPADQAGSSRAQLQALLTHHRGSLRSSGTLAGDEQTRRAEARRRDKATLIDWARNAGILLTEYPDRYPINGPQDKGGSEHHVFHDASNRWVKITKGDGSSFGYQPLDEGKDDEWMISKDPADLLSYLEKLALHNHVFHDDIVLHAVVADPLGKVALIISQPDYQGTFAGVYTSIKPAMEAAGFVRVEPPSARKETPSAYYRPADNVAVVDLHDQNAILEDNGTFLRVFDNIMLQPTGALRATFERLAAKRTASQAGNTLAASDRTPTQAIEATGLAPAISVNGKAYTGRPGMTHGTILGDYVWRKVFTPQQRRDDPNQDTAVNFAHDPWMDSRGSGFDDFGFLDTRTGKFLTREEAYTLLTERGFTPPAGSYSLRHESLDSSDLFNSTETAGLAASPHLPVSPSPSLATQVAAAAAATNTNPTKPQQDAENYKTGKVDLHGLRLSIENPAGSVRSGTDANGKSWSITMPHHYGRILGTVGRDKDHLDFFLGPNPDSQLVLIVNQRKTGNGHFDEHKLMLGFNTPAEAAKGYLKSYSPGWKGFQSAVPTTIPVLKHWITTHDTTQPVTKEQIEKLAKTVPLPSSAHDKPTLPISPSPSLPVSESPPLPASNRLLTKAVALDARLNTLPGIEPAARLLDQATSGAGKLANLIPQAIGGTVNAITSLGQHLPGQQALAALGPQLGAADQAAAAYVGNKIADGFQRVSGKDVRKAPDAVAAWLQQPAGLGAWTKNVVVDQLLPNALLPREFLALTHEMQRKAAFGTEKSNDLLRALSGNPRLSDLAYPKEFAENMMYREQMFDAMEGRFPMASLPPEMQRLAERLRTLLRETGAELVRQGIMHPDTFAELQTNGWMPRYTLDEAMESGGSVLAAFKLGVRDLLQQRSTAYHIVDTARKGKDGQPPTVNRREGGRNAWRFRDAASRDAFYHDFVRQQTLDMLQEGGNKIVADMLAPLSRGDKMAMRDQIKRLTVDQIANTAKLSPMLAGIVKQAKKHQYDRFAPKDPFEPEKLIKDPVYAIARYVLAQTHNAATMELLRETAKHPEWVSDVALQGFTEIPDGDRFGPLAGKFVQADIAAQILDKLDIPNAALRFYDAILRKWKSGKLVWNPGSHIRDAVGNTVFAYLGGSNIFNPGNWPYYQKALAVMRNGGPLYAELIENAVLGGDAYSSLVRERLKGLLPDAKTVENFNPGLLQRLFFDFGAKFHATHEQVAEYRRMPDDFYKIAAYLKAKDSMSAPEAAAHVRKWFPYYDRLGGSATTRAAGRFINPFLSFFRESTRILATAAVERPIALSAALAFPAAITALSACALFLGLDDRDREEIAKDLSGRGKGILGLGGLHLFSMLLPWRSSQGQVQQFDISAIMPFADLLGQKIVPLEEKENAWQTFWRQTAAAGPVGNLGVAWITNRDLFSGRHLVEADMSTREMLGAYTQHAAGVALPPLLPDAAAAVGIGDGGALTRAGTRQVNKTLATYDPVQTIIRSVFGMNVKSAAPNLYRQADDFRAANGYDVQPGFDYGTTVTSRAKRLLVQQLAQDTPNPQAIANLVKRLKTLGVPMDTEGDIAKTLSIIDPASLIGGSKKAGLSAEDARQRFRQSLPPESRTIYEAALSEFQRIKRRAPLLVRQAASL